ncbi:MAG: DUF790 family protein [Candidatus Brocadiae bacterium]|nr:DUF790 family protein [Candidatus Brocadiia bacterium]
MLGLELVRIRYRSGKIIPLYIDTEDPQLLSMAQNLIILYEEYKGKTREELQDALKPILNEGKDIIVYRGFCKLLEDLCSFETECLADPIETRKALFAIASRHHIEGSFDREKILEEAAAILQSTAKNIESGMYADLKQNHILQEMKPISSENLLKRYNTSLAQSILLKATSLQIEIQEKNSKRYRQLFRAIKFYRLLYQIKGTMEDGFMILLDGPMSLFQACHKYGLQMALFLPALLLCEGWSLKAELVWKAKKNYTLSLDYKTRLYSHYPDTGMYQPPELAQFEDRFRTLKSGWEISDECFLLDIGQEICIPDYRFVHFSTNCVVYIEIFGFWHKAALERRMLHLKESKHNLLLAVSKNLNVEEKLSLWEDKHIYFFHQVLHPKEILEHLKKYCTENP